MEQMLLSAKVVLVTGQITINDGGSLLLTAADGAIDDLRAPGSDCSKRLVAAGLTLISTEVLPVLGFDLGWLI